MSDTPDMNKKYKILLIGLAAAQQKLMETLCTNMEPQKGCEIYVGKITLELYIPHQMANPYENAHGIITLFDHSDIDSFNNLPNVISDAIHNVGKMLPTIVVGLNMEEKSIHEEPITKEDILDYLYKLGDTCACMVPYIELTDQESAGLIFIDLIKIIECSSIDNCFGIQAIRRGRCGIHQYQQLKVETNP